MVCIFTKKKNVEKVLFDVWPLFCKLEHTITPSFDIEINLQCNLKYDTWNRYMYWQCNKECHYRKQYRFLWYRICIYLVYFSRLKMAFVKVFQLLPIPKEHQSYVFVGEGTISDFQNRVYFAQKFWKAWKEEAWFMNEWNKLDKINAISVWFIVLDTKIRMLPC